MVHIVIDRYIDSQLIHNKMRTELHKKRWRNPEKYSPSFRKPYHSGKKMFNSQENHLIAETSITLTDSSRIPSRGLWRVQYSKFQVCWCIWRKVGRSFFNFLRSRLGFLVKELSEKCIFSNIEEIWSTRLAGNSQLVLTALRKGNPMFIPMLRRSWKNSIWENSMKN